MAFDEWNISGKTSISRTTCFRYVGINFRNFISFFLDDQRFFVKTTVNELSQIVSLFLEKIKMS